MGAGVLTRSAEEGPVRLELTLASNELAMNDRVRLVVNVEAESGVTVHYDDYLSLLLAGDRRFEIGGTLLAKSEGTPDGNGKLRWRYAYELTGFLPGTYEIPGASVSFSDMRSKGADVAASDDVEEVTVSTEPISVVVADVRSEPLTPEELGQIAMPDPVELRRPVSLVAWGAVVAALLAVGLLAWAVRRRRDVASTVQIVPAHIWARAQLDALVAANLPAKGQVQEFYYRVSGIVRGYLERRFYVSAPEMTTEEFLTVSRGDARLAGADAESLGAFLTACDLVKYARHEPTSREADQAVAAAENFVEQTRLRDETVAPADSSVGHDGGRAR